MIRENWKVGRKQDTTMNIERDWFFYKLPDGIGGAVVGFSFWYMIFFLLNENFFSLSRSLSLSLSKSLWFS